MIMSEKINDNLRYEKDKLGIFCNITFTSAMLEICYGLVDIRLNTGRKCPVSNNRLLMDLPGKSGTELSGFSYGVILEVDNRETLT